jgi:hypothetical protein
MKKTYKVLALTAVFLLAGYVLQAQPHPNQQNGGGAVTGDRIGAGAPIGDGVNILLLSALAFGAFKFYRSRHHALRLE